MFCFRCSSYLLYNFPRNSFHEFLLVTQVASRKTHPWLALGSVENSADCMGLRAVSAGPRVVLIESHFREFQGIAPPRL